MNRIFKLVWNPHVGALVVASELTKGAPGVTALCDVTSGMPRRISLGVALLSAMGLGAQAAAAELEDIQAVIAQYAQPVDDLAVLLAPHMPEDVKKTLVMDEAAVVRRASIKQDVVIASPAPVYDVTPSDQIGRVLQTIAQSTMEPQSAQGAERIESADDVRGGRYRGDVPRVQAALRPRDPMLLSRTSGLQSQQLPGISLVDAPTGLRGAAEEPLLAVLSLPALPLSSSTTENASLEGVSDVAQGLTGVATGNSGLFSASSPPQVRMMSATPSTVGSAMMSITPAAAPVVPPSSGTASGLVVANGGVVGSVTSLLTPTVNALLGSGDGFVRNGGTAIHSSNFVQAYTAVGVGPAAVINLSPVGTLLSGLGGVATGSNSHLTVIGGATSDSYITSINNGNTGGILGLLLPTSAPEWASECLNILNVASVDCWAINAAQDYQVLVGDGAYANGSKEVVIGTGARHELPAVDASVAFAGDGFNDPDNPTGVPTADYASRLGHSVVIGDSAVGSANAQVLIGAGAKSNQANSVALGYNSEAMRGGVSNYTAYAVGAGQTSTGEVSVGSVGGERQITNVAPGSLSTDAVNVAQLQAAVMNADPFAVRYGADVSNGVDRTTLNLGDNNTSTLVTNVAAGDVSSSSLHAVNGGQLFSHAQNLAVQLGGGSSVTANGLFVAPSYSIGMVNADRSIARNTYANVGDAFAAIDTSLTNLASVSSGSAGAGAVMYDRDASNNVNLARVTLGAGASPTVISNLGAGQVSASSLDAVNGAQLYKTQQSIVTLVGGGVGVNPQTFAISGVGFSLPELGISGQWQRSSYDNLTDAFESIGRSLLNVTTITHTGGGLLSPYVTINSQGDVALAPGAEAVSIGSKTSAQGQNSVAVGYQATASAANSVAIGAGSTANRTNSVAVGSDGNERQITYVASGTQNSDAVNLGQLKDSEKGGVRYTVNNIDNSVDYTQITLGRPNVGPTVIHNVANGLVRSDAVNLGQLQDGLDWSRQYTDDRFSSVSGEMKKIDNRASAGVASAMAMAGLPQPFEAGRSMASAGLSTFNGESSMAIGLSGVSEGGRWIYKISGSANTRGDAGVTLGAGVQW